MNDAGGRWWEVRDETQPDHSGDPELVPNSSGRTRPERSLSAGVDLADMPRHPARALLWPVVSVVAAVALILSVGYVVSVSKPTSSSSALPAQPVDRPEVAAGPNQPSGPAAQLGAPPAVDGGAPAPTGRPAAVARGSADDTPGRTAAAPDRTAAAPAASSAPPAGATGPQPTPTPTVSTPTPAPAPTLTLDGPAPPAPGPQQAGQPARGRGGNCRIDANTRSYGCLVQETAPIYQPDTTDLDRRSPLPAGPRLFLCQSDGSAYSIGNRTNHWWAWVGDSDDGAWLPVVYLVGARNDAPAGLPICADPGSGTPAPTPSSAPSGPAEVTMIDHKTGRCLDSNDEGVVHTVDCNGTDDQKWKTPGDGTIRDKQTKRCLDSDDEGRVYTLECNGGGYQKWQPFVDGTIRNSKTGRCLDSNDNGDVYTLDYNGGDYQRWIVK
ncbi:MAG: RICIN domain-containing protein [Pseudonocardiaceae bacterium]